MRKYYSKATSAKAMSKILMCSDIHWTFLESLIRGYGSASLGESFYETALGVTQSRDVGGYLKLGDILTSGLQLYNPFHVKMFSSRYQVCAFLKKFPFSQEEYAHDRRQAAKIKLLEAEAMCRATNEKLRGCHVNDRPSWVSKARRLVADLLGTLTPGTVMGILGCGKHGPGSTLSSEGDRVTPYYKYADFPYTVTRSAVPYALAAISLNPRWMKILEDSGRRTEIPPAGAPLFQKELMIFWDCVEVVDSDRITFVPKDARTERPIAVGASLNLYLQLGVKAYLEDKLRNVGVDLRDQTKNQQLAQAGSVHFGCEEVPNLSQFSTIDLSSASDTISYELVKMLLPSDWFAFLCDLRHESGMVDGELLVYEKFSAMGNGFTFPLETLVFWAIAKATAQDQGHQFRRSDFAIYGDDIIVRYAISADVIRNLEWAGFKVNSEKSFLAGPFKESCGKDFLHGIDVRPFYLKRRVVTHEDVYFIANSISDICMRHSGNAGLVQLYMCCLAQVPRNSRLYVPLGDFSDRGLRVPFSTLSGLGIRPYLTDVEKSHLSTHGLLLEDSGSPTPYAWCVTESARVFKGRESIRLYTWFEGKVERQRSLYDAASSSCITRRNRVRRTVFIRPVPDWDGLYERSQTKLHPFWVCNSI
nr:MAG: hypothetical protein 3 [Leviviridae sp.]